MAAPTYQGFQSASAAGTSTLTIATGAGNLDLASGDIIVAAGVQDNTNAGTLAAFGGTFTGTWTTIIADGDDLAPQMALRWARATGTHSGQTITQARIGASGASGIVAVSIRGAVASGSPIGGSAAQWFTSEPADWTPGISSLGADSIVLFGDLDTVGSANQWSSQTQAGNAMTERQDIAGAVAWGARLATIALTAAGAVGTFDATWAITSTTDRRLWAVTVESQGADAGFRPSPPYLPVAVHRAANW